MRISILLLFFSLTIMIGSAQKLQVKELTCESQENPLGIDVKDPHFSWKLITSQRDIKQKS
jgi:alpha-L-rhamnosidase